MLDSSRRVLPYPTSATALAVSLLTVLLASGVLLVSASPAWAAEPAVYGAGAGEGELMSIREILADPEAYEGQEVRVRGKIEAVCKMAGCWMDLRDGEDALLRVKVKDGEIVFPEDAVGQEAIARGRLEIHDMDREQYVGWLRHLAEEQGEEFDESSVGPGPYRLIQIAGVGASVGG
ncbi:MAG: DUF4920 domain-containing protein [Holophagales bacterium]|nr:DUF4920 domain-containing protein [Holophagales bacterium]